MHLQPVLIGYSQIDDGKRDQMKKSKE